MKEEYLWNKTGEDLEIQQLENALQTFRYQKNMPPILPGKVLNLEKETPRSFFGWFPTRFAFATASCLGICAILAFVIWFQLAETNPNAVIVADAKQEKTENLSEELRKAKLPENKPKIIETKFVISRQTVKPQFVKLKQNNNLPAYNSKKMLLPQVKKLIRLNGLPKKNYTLIRN